MNRARFAIVVPNPSDLWTLRRPLLQALLQADTEVLAIAPRGPWTEKVRRLGCQVLPWSLERGSLQPLAEGKALCSLFQLYQAWKPTLVHHFTIKPNIYGTLAARAAGIPVAVATVTGLGYFWAEDGARSRVVRSGLTALYRRALKMADAVIFQNADDRTVLGSGRWSMVIPGEGVDLNEFDPQTVSQERREALRREVGTPVGVPIVLMVARMLWHKGVEEFVTAARLLQKQRPDAVFLLVGPADLANPAGVPPEQLQAWDAEGAVRYLGLRDDVRDLMAVADVVVLPSYYREGVPRVLVEAAAMGKPLVTTDVPGCREVVEEGYNGLRVPPRDSQALANAIMMLLRDPERRAQFGRASRSVAEARFSSRRLVAQCFSLYETLLTRKGLEVPVGLKAWLLENDPV